MAIKRKASFNQGTFLDKVGEVGALVRTAPLWTFIDTSRSIP
jgi:hypothetical protein